MLKSELLAAIQREIHSHDFDYFAEPLPEGGRVIVPGCANCRVRIHTMSEFLDHLANDAMPSLFARILSQGK